MAFRIYLLFIYIALCFLSLYHANAFKLADWARIEPRITGFSWKNCGPATDSIQIKTLVVTPDPVHIPGNITVDTTFSIASAGATDMTVAITMEKKIAGFWVKVPCIDNLGSCTYGNTCKSWTENCPKHFAKYGIPCTCPIPPNTYSVPDAVADVTRKLPPGSAGDIRIAANFVSPTIGHLGCLQIEVTVAT